MAVAVPYIIEAVAATALSYIASSLLAKTPKPIVDQTPSTTSQRGEFLPLLQGRRRLGPNQVWFGDRTVKTEGAAGGKGGTGAGSSQLVYRESANHVFAIGPCHSLYTIWLNGDIIYQPVGGIDQISHPSGSTINIPNIGDFIIYWGEQDSPVDTFLAQPGRIGIASKWKFCARLVWVQFRMGGFPVWGALEAEWECRPYKPGNLVGVNWDSLPERLSGSDGWIDNEIGPSGNAYNIVDGYDNLEVAPRGNIKVSGDQTASFIAGSQAKVTNQGYYIYANRYLNVFSSVYSSGEVHYTPLTYSAFSFNEPTLSGSNWVKTNIVVSAGAIAGATASAPAGGLFTLTNGGSFPRSLGWNAAHSLSTSTYLLKRYRNRASIFIYQFGSGGVTDISMSLQPFNGATTHFHTVEFKYVSGLTQIIYSGGNVKGYVTQINSDWKRFDIVLVAGHGIPGNVSDTTYHYALALDFTNNGSGTNIIVCGTEFDFDDGTVHTGTTTINFVETITNIDENVNFGLATQSNIQDYRPGFGPGGPNAAHVIDQLLFETFPHGSGCDRTQFDISSLEDCGTTLEAEGLRTHIIAQNGQTFEATLGAIFLDIGMFCAWDRVSGLFKFTLIRAPGGGLPTIPEQLISDPKPERFAQREQKVDDKAIFGFPDAALNYKDNIVVEAEDARASVDQNQKGDVVTLTTVIDVQAAIMVAERRAQEILNPLQKVQLTVLRDGGDFYPGQAINVFDFDDIQRVIEQQVDPKSRRVVSTLVTDSYSLTPGSSLVAAVYFPPDVPPIVPDAAVQILELPPALRPTNTRAIAILRIRGANNAGSGAIYISGDGLTYVQVRNNSKYVTGGTIYDAGIANAGTDITTGPIVYGLGPDVVELSQTLNATDWALGRQLWICGTEIGFLETVVPLGDNLYRLDGLKRAKYGTAHAAHAFGDTIYIVDPAKLEPIYDPLIAYPNTVYIKTQPSTSKDSISLAAVTAVSHAIAATPLLVGEMFDEVPSGTIDGVNTNFVLVGVPNPTGSLILLRNGLTQTEGNDYSISGSNITFLAGAIPQTGDSLLAKRYLQ